MRTGETQEQPEDSGGGGLPNGAIIAMVVAMATLLLIAGVLLWYKSQEASQSRLSCWDTCALVFIHASRTYAVTACAF